MTRWTEAKLGGYSLLFGTVAVAVGYAFSPGRGMVDTVPSTSLADLTLAMARNATLSYTVAVVLVLGALLMLNGIVTLRKYAAPVPRLGLLGMAVGAFLQMVMRGFDYMLIGMGEAALGPDPEQSAQWLESALGMQRTVWGHRRGAGPGVAGAVHRRMALEHAGTVPRSGVRVDVRQRHRLHGAPGVAVGDIRGRRPARRLSPRLTGRHSPPAAGTPATRVQATRPPASRGRSAVCCGCPPGGRRRAESGPQPFPRRSSRSLVPR